MAENGRKRYDLVRLTTIYDINKAQHQLSQSFQPTRGCRCRQKLGVLTPLRFIEESVLHFQHPDANKQHQQLPRRVPGQDTFAFQIHNREHLLLINLRCRCSGRLDKQGGNYNYESLYPKGESSGHISCCCHLRETTETDPTPVCAVPYGTNQPTQDALPAKTGKRAHQTIYIIAG